MKPSNLEKCEELTEDLTLTQMIEKVSSRLLLNAKQLVELIHHILFISSPVALQLRAPPK